MSCWYSGLNDCFLTETIVPLPQSLLSHKQISASSVQAVMQHICLADMLHNSPLSGPLWCITSQYAGRYDA